MEVAGCERRGEPAVVADLVRRLGYAAESGLVPTLRILERKGVLSIHGGGARGRARVVRLSTQGKFAVGMGGIPLLGTIPAGPLSEALAQPEEILSEQDWLTTRAGDFLLRVRGDSMMGDGILSGDLVLIRPDVELTRGEIAAVQVGNDHEATLKHVFLEGEKLILRASNPAFADMVVAAAEVRIAGAFRGLIRDVGRRG